MIQIIKRKELKEYAIEDFMPFAIRPIEDLEFTSRTNSALKGNEIFLIAQLLLKTEWDVLKLPNIGKKSLYEIKDVIESRGWHLKYNKPFGLKKS
jgi:DNA-directed RNA polymerase subunit alpha